MLLTDGRPLKVKALTCTFNIAAGAVLTESPTFTLHSLRRGATQACETAGIRNLSHAGKWKSNVIHAYLSNSDVKLASAALSNLFV